jgi:hypothetical protein
MNDGCKMTAFFLENDTTTWTFKINPRRQFPDSLTQVDVTSILHTGELAMQDEMSIPKARKLWSNLVNLHNAKRVR